MTKLSSGAEGSAAKQVLLQTASGTRTSSHTIASVEGGAVSKRANDEYYSRVRHPGRDGASSLRGPGSGVPRSIYPHQSDHERGARAAARSTRGAEADKRKYQGGRRSRRSYKPTSMRSRPTTRSRPFPPFKQDSKSPIADVSSPTEQARNQRVVIRTPAREAIAEEHRETKTCPPEPHLLRTTSINLTSGHSPRHPAEATKSCEASLYDRRRKCQKPSPKTGQRTRLVARKRKMESSVSRELSRKTESNLRGCRCWAFKMPEIVGTERE